MELFLEWPNHRKKMKKIEEKFQNLFCKIKS